MALRLWADSHSEITDDVDLVSEELTVCSSTASYDYESTVHSFKNNTCLPHCANDSISSSCVALLELIEETAGRESVTVGTHLQETYLRTDVDSNLTIPATTNHFIKDIHRVGIHFSYSFVVPASYYTESTFFSSSVDVTTVVLDSEGDVWDTYEPSTTLFLNMQEFLQLSGQPDLLSTTLNEGGPNILNASFGLGPIVRMSGQELVLLLECGTQDALAESRDWQGLTVCFISVNAPDVPTPWASYSRILPSADRSLLRYRTFRGLLVVSEVIGTFYHFDHYELYLWLVGCLVIMRIPNSIMHLITTRFLGHLSRMYRRTMIERYNLTKQIARVPVELMMNTAAFRELADSEGGITREAFQTSMIEALKAQRDILDEHELGNVVEVCFKQMKREWKRNPLHESLRSRLLHSGFKKDMTAMRLSRTDVDMEDTRSLDTDSISEDCFIHCSMLGSGISFHDLVKMFDQDRRKGVFERFFMPSKLRNLTRVLSEDTRHSVELSLQNADEIYDRTMTHHVTQTRLEVLEQRIKHMSCMMSSERTSLTKQKSDISSLLSLPSNHSAQLALKKATVANLEALRHECQTAIEQSSADMIELINIVKKDMSEQIQSLQVRLDEQAASLTEFRRRADVPSIASPVQAAVTATFPESLTDRSTGASVPEKNLLPPPSRARQGRGPLAEAAALCDAAASPSGRAQAPPAPPPAGVPPAPFVPMTSARGAVAKVAPQVQPFHEHSSTSDGQQTQDLAEGYHNLGLSNYKTGDYAQALECHRKALEMRQAHLGNDHLDVAATLNNMGVVFHQQQDLQNALLHHERALEVRRNALGENHEKVAESYHNIALVQRQMNDYSKSLESHKSAAAVQSRTIGASHQKTGDSHYNIAGVLSLMNRDTEAIEHFAKTLEIWRASPELGASHKAVAGVFSEMAASYSKLGEHQLAFECHENALNIRMTSYSEGHPKLAGIYKAMATSLQALGRTQEADECYQKEAAARSGSCNRTADPFIATL
eukprot:NODE_128_length_3568_cov_11.569602.p1 GENE.NODE_128_length_3568_cov_11.569602~~NODE_128_length_3568_cov_11.569602.p1  ORF type:complete len:1093 (-),score=245.13 NODE_128_length_3568_cov_11.569602:290-3295(-)